MGSDGKIAGHRGFRLWATYGSNAISVCMLGIGFAPVLATGGSSAVEQWTVKLPCAVIHWSVVQIHLPGIFIFALLQYVRMQNYPYPGSNWGSFAC